MTIGRKLMIGSVSLLALTMILNVSSFSITRSLGNELSRTASVTAHNLELAGKTAADAASMLSAERGLLLRLALGDQPAATTLHQNFAATAKEIERDLQQIRNSDLSQQTQAAAARMSDTLSTWLLADNEMWQLCARQDYQSAFKLFDDKVAPKAESMQTGADQI